MKRTYQPKKRQNKKEHGLSENIVNYLLKNPIGLVLIPDAGTNDTKECKTLCELGFKVVILDHHQKENENEKTVFCGSTVHDAVRLRVGHGGDDV